MCFFHPSCHPLLPRTRKLLKWRSKCTYSDITKNNVIHIDKNNDHFTSIDIRGAVEFQTCGFHFPMKNKYAISTTLAKFMCVYTNFPIGGMYCIHFFLVLRIHTCQSFLALTHSHSYNDTLYLMYVLWLRFVMITYLYKAKYLVLFYERYIKSFTV